MGNSNQVTFAQLFGRFLMSLPSSASMGRRAILLRSRVARMDPTTPPSNFQSELEIPQGQSLFRVPERSTLFGMKKQVLYSTMTGRSLESLKLRRNGARLVAWRRKLNRVCVEPQRGSLVQCRAPRLMIVRGRTAGNPHIA